MPTTALVPKRRDNYKPGTTPRRQRFECLPARRVGASREETTSHFEQSVVGNYSHIWRTFKLPHEGVCESQSIRIKFGVSRLIDYRRDCDRDSLNRTCHPEVH